MRDHGTGLYIIGSGAVIVGPALDLKRFLRFFLRSFSIWALEARFSALVLP